MKAALIDFDIIHGHSGGPISMMGWQIARMKGIPYILTYHTMWKHYAHYFFLKHVLKPRILTKLSAVLGNFSDAVIAPTQKVQQALLSYGVRKPIYVIPSGINIEHFETAEKGYLRKQYGIPKSKRILLTVGRLGREKSIDFLIAAFAIAQKIESNMVFVVVGEGKDKEKLQRYAQRLGVSEVVYFIGTVPFDKMPSIYSDSDLFIFSSHTETQGLVIVEAMAGGVPVIAVTDGAFEGVIKNGINGYIVKRNVSHFAKKIVDMMRIPDIRWQMGRNAKKKAADFSIHTTTNMIENVYYDFSLQKGQTWQEETIAFEKA